MTPEAEAILLNKLTTVVRDLNDHGTGDGEAMFMLGAGADRLCQAGKAGTWPSLKAKLSPAETAALLAQIDREGETASADSKIKHAYALQILGLSVVATGASDPRILTGANLLDNMIATALANYRRHARNGATLIN